jgi:hypothetical protein
MSEPATIIPIDLLTEEEQKFLTLLAEIIAKKIVNQKAKN